MISLQCPQMCAVFGSSIACYCLASHLGITCKHLVAHLCYTQLEDAELKNIPHSDISEGTGTGVNRLELFLCSINFMV